MARRSPSPSAPVAPKPNTTIPAPRWLHAVILLLAAFALMAHTSREVTDNDTWWHLKTGQWMLQHRALPMPDPFAYTTYLRKPSLPGEEAARDFNLTHEWLAQILFYLAYAGGGYAGMVLLRSALLAAFCGAIGFAVYQRTRGFYRGVLATLAAGTVAVQFFSDRPYLITFLFLALTIVILESGRRLWLLPIMFLIWANCHGGFFMGWVILGLYCGEALLLRFRGAPPGERQLWIFSLGSIVISCLNPNGVKVLPIMLSYRASPMQSTIMEWQYPLPWPPVPFSILLACALVVMVWQRRRTRPVDWLLLLVFGAALSLTAVRNIILAAVVGPLIIFSYVPWKIVLPVAAEYAAAAALLFLGAVPPIARGDAFQFHASDWKFCGGAADFMLAHHVTGPMFNTYEMGGYLIWRLWPQERTFIDGRALNETIFQDYNRIAFNAAATNGNKSGEELLKDYGIEVIVMDGFEYTSGNPYNLTAALTDPSQTEWKLVYQDAQAMIYMRHPPPGVTPLNSFEGLAGLELQCSTYLDHDRGHPRCALGLADLFAKIGDGARASKWRAIYAQHPE